MVTAAALSLSLSQNENIIFPLAIKLLSLLLSNKHYINISRGAAGETEIICLLFALCETARASLRCPDERGG